MAKGNTQAEFKSYNGKTEFFEHEEKKFAEPNEKQGGPIDPYGDVEKKENSAINMNAGEAFNKKFTQQVDAEGSDYPKKGNYDQMDSNKGEHFKTETDNADIDPSGTDCGKSTSYQSRH